MCGIAGIVTRLPQARPDRARLERMCDRLRHRGPDDSGVLVEGNAGFGHRRLSIIDPAAGRQPMTNPEGTVWITYNGEIYNFRELRASLTARGHAFATRCDTEVVLRAYEAFGDRCVERLQGMFAFAIWDRPRRRLLLARDRLGIKPLYFAVSGDEIVFASEIKAILAADPSRRALNRTVLPEFLATRFVSGTETFFEGVHKLLPGRTLSWSADAGFRERRYWQLPAAAARPEKSLRANAVELRSRLEDTVRSHLVSDVPVGVFLSGGLDSSGLAALMAAQSPEPVNSFSIGFADDAFNELRYARMLAESIGARHRDVVLSPAQFFAALPSLVWHEDEPIAFSSSVPLYFVSRLAREHVKVVLTGEGADELFLGYNRYRIAAWNARFGHAWRALAPRALRAAVSRAVPRLPSAIRRYAERTFLARGTGASESFYENFAVFGDGLQRELLTGPLSAFDQDAYEYALGLFDEAPAGTLERMMHADMRTYLVELLMKQDQMSMAASVESRVPFLDHTLVEHVARIPGTHKLNGLRTKVVLREALKGLVPQRILTRRKMGFPVPVGRWFRGDWWPVVEEFVLGERARARGLFAADTVARIAGEHRAGACDHGERLWLLVNFEIWQRIFLDGEHVEAVMEPARKAA